MKKTHDAVYVEKYTTKSGEEKKRYTNCGALFARDDGSMALKIESIPVAFNGWLALYAPREEQRPSAGATKAKAAVAAMADDGDTIPF